MTIMTDNLEEIISHFDNFKVFKLSRYSLLFHKDIKISKDWILLDLGCGEGRLAKLICSSIKEYYGIDISGNTIERAKERCRDITNAKFYQNNGFDLKMFKDNFFDVVAIETVLQHTGKKSIESYIKEIFRVLKKGGFFVANFPKLEFYKSYGFTMGELKMLLKDFSWMLLKYDSYWRDDAYFFVYAGKVV